jgi:hypothetical protein
MAVDSSVIRTQLGQSERIEAYGSVMRVTVSDVRPVAELGAEAAPTGQPVAATVRIEALDGSWTTSPTHFAAKTADGTEIQPKFGLVAGELPTSSLQSGETLEGLVGFDVPAGQNITEIVMAAPLMARDRIWTVPQGG